MEGDIYGVGGDRRFLASLPVSFAPPSKRDRLDERRVDEGGGLGAPVGDISQPVFNEFEEVDRRFFAREPAYRRGTTIVPRGPRTMPDGPRPEKLDPRVRGLKRPVFW